MRILLKGFTADGINEPSRMAVLIENDRIIAVEKNIYGCSAADKIIEFKDEIMKVKEEKDELKNNQLSRLTEFNIANSSKTLKRIYKYLYESK